MINYNEKLLKESTVSKYQSITFFNLTIITSNESKTDEPPNLRHFGFLQLYGNLNYTRFHALKKSNS